MQVESPEVASVALEESRTRFAELLFGRIFRELKPRAPLPKISFGFFRYANANAQIKLNAGTLEVRWADTFLTAPDPVYEALARILLGKLFRKPAPRSAAATYRRWILRHDVQKDLEGVRRERGWKQVDPPQGDAYDLEQIFEELNFRYFFGLMARPKLGWSRNSSRTLLGHYDPSHHTIVLSRILDRTEVPRCAVEYVVYHEMLHLKHPTELRGAKRCVHTPAFKEEERRFDGLAEAKLALKRL